MILYDILTASNPLSSLKQVLAKNGDCCYIIGEDIDLTPRQA